MEVVSRGIKWNSFVIGVPRNITKLFKAQICF